MENITPVNKKEKKMNVSRFEYYLISKICNRVDAIAHEQMIEYNKENLFLDLVHTHRNTELALDLMLNGPDIDLVHDINGISNNINRQTKQLENSFQPRFALNNHLK
jgi:hypothetical protein